MKEEGVHCLDDQRKRSRIWKLGDHVDTDIIIPTEYLALSSIEAMKPYAFSPLDRQLSQNIQPGDVIVAGKNFGCGSSREQAPEVLMALQVRCIIAESFARIFYRNAINNGLRLIENKALARCCEDGQYLEWSGEDEVIYKGQCFKIMRLPEALQAISKAGGLVHYWQKQNSVEEGRNHHERDTCTKTI